MLLGTRDQRLLSELRRWRVITDCVEQLSETERRVLFARLDGRETLAATARAVGVPKRRVCQIEERIVSRLADALFGPEPESP
jgi:DNA-directed RNA polymerase specialized sigma subunit